MKIIRNLVLTGMLVLGFSLVHGVEGDEDLYTLYHRIFVDTTKDNIPFRDLLVEIYHRLPTDTEHEKQLKQKLKKQFEKKFGSVPEEVELPSQIELPPLEKYIDNNNPKRALELSVGSLIDKRKYKQILRTILEQIIPSVKSSKSIGIYSALYDAYVNYNFLVMPTEVS